MTINVRSFKPSDSDELWKLHMLTVLHAGFSQEVAEWDKDLHAVDENYTAKGGCFLVATGDNGRLIAMGGFVPTDSESIELKRMRVHPDLQQNGVGKTILRALEVQAMKFGFKRAHLDTANSKAKPFYERNGYSFTKAESEGGFEFYFFEKSLHSES